MDAKMMNQTIDLEIASRVKKLNTDEKYLKDMLGSFPNYTVVAQVAAELAQQQGAIAALRSARGYLNTEIQK